ncbi:hypothetical protein U1Q18_028967 [Sarracenia purpurea var. burkii]
MKSSFTATLNHHLQPSIISATTSRLVRLVKARCRDETTRVEVEEGNESVIVSDNNGIDGRVVPTEIRVLAWVGWVGEHSFERSGSSPLPPPFNGYWPIIVQSESENE